MRSRGPIVAGAVSGLIALVLVVLFVLPKMGQVGKAQDELQAARDQEIALQTQLHALQDAQAQAPQTQEEIQALEDQVPSTVDLPGLFRLLQAVADRAAVDWFQFSPGAPAADPSGTFSVLSSQITVTGSYFSLQEYLYGLETLPRASKVMSVSLSPLGGEVEAGVTTSGRLTGQLTVEFYTTDPNAGPGALPVPGEDDGGGDGTEAAPTDTPAPTGPTGA